MLIARARSQNTRKHGRAAGAGFLPQTLQIQWRGNGSWIKTRCDTLSTHTITQTHALTGQNEVSWAAQKSAGKTSNLTANGDQREKKRTHAHAHAPTLSVRVRVRVSRPWGPGRKQHRDLVRTRKNTKTKRRIKIFLHVSFLSPRSCRVSVCSHTSSSAPHTLTASFSPLSSRQQIKCRVSAAAFQNKTNTKQNWLFVFIFREIAKT